MRETDTPESLDMEENDNQIDVMFSQVSLAVTSVHHSLFVAQPASDESAQPCRLEAADDLPSCSTTTLPRSASATLCVLTASQEETWSVSVPPCKSGHCQRLSPQQARQTFSRAFLHFACL